MVTSRPFLDTDADSEWAITPIDVEEAQRQYDAERERRERAARCSEPCCCGWQAEDP